MTMNENSEAHVPAAAIATYPGPAPSLSTTRPRLPMRGMAAEPSVPRTLLGRRNDLEGKVNELGKLISKAETLADRLGGTVPEVASDSPAPMAVPNGLIDEFGEELTRFGRALNRLDHQLSRIADAI